MVTTAKPELNPSHNTGKSEAPSCSPALLKDSSSSPLSHKPVAVPYSGPSNSLPHPDSGASQTQPQILRTSALTPNLLSLLFSVLGTPHPLSPLHSPSHQQATAQLRLHLPDPPAPCWSPGLQASLQPNPGKDTSKTLTPSAQRPFVDPSALRTKCRLLNMTFKASRKLVPTVFPGFTSHM